MLSPISCEVSGIGADLKVSVEEVCSETRLWLEMFTESVTETVRFEGSLLRSEKGQLWAHVRNNARTVCRHHSLIPPDFTGDSMR